MSINTKINFDLKIFQFSIPFSPKSVKKVLVNSD